MHRQLEDGAKHEVTGGVQAACGLSVLHGLPAIPEKSMAQALVKTM